MTRDRVPPRSGNRRPAAAAGERRRSRAPAPVAPGATALGFAWIVTAVTILIGVSFRLYDTDAWQHLAVGRAFWTLHRMPLTEVWTWPNYGQPVVNPSWGFSVLIWPFWALGGVVGLEVWRWLTTLLVTVQLGLAARRLGANALAMLPILVIGMLIYRERVQIRPETVAGVWFALALWILSARRAGGRDHAWWLVPFACVWVNTHVSYDLLFVLIGVHLVGGKVDHEPASRKRLAAVAVTGFAASFLNPFGWRAVWRPFEYFITWRHEPLFRSIRELGPVVWSQNLWNGLPLLLLGWPLLAAWRTRHGRRDAVEWLMLAVFAVLGASSARFVPIVALAATPFVARDVSEWLGAHPFALTRWRPWPRALATAACCVAVAVPDWRAGVLPFGLDFDMSRAPVAACDYMARNGVRGRGMDHFAFGGYLLWRFWPDRGRLPFIDIHPEDSARETRELYYRALTDPAGWDTLETRERFDYGLFSRRYADRPGLLDRLDADPDWALVFVDDVAALYLRRDGALAALATRDAYHTLGGSRASIPSRLERAAADSLLRVEMRAELARQAAVSPADFYGRAMGRALDRMDAERGARRAGTQPP